MGKKHTLEDKINDLEEEIAEKTAFGFVEKIRDHTKNMCNLEGSFSNNKMWNLKKKILPRTKEVAHAKKDADGRLVTNPEIIKKNFIYNAIKND